MISVKQILEETSEIEKAWKKLDMSWIMETQYKHSGYFLNDIIIEVERNLIAKQKEDLPNEKTIVKFEKTLNRLLLIQEYFNKSQSYIRDLELQNEQMKQKFETYKINIK
jgi:hypothetical protein